ncbi:MAG: Lrp/AsnC family transcriptional regulator [Alcaligenaceae bacterium]|nr:Lrp/AsnC family transcriptional regulator [Alcaligenaceae bacterium]
MTTPPTPATRQHLPATPARPTAPAPELDDLDRRILEHLQYDASLTNQELAQQVHASPPTCLRRVRRLIQTGIIEKQVAIVNPERLGNSLTAICEITLDVQTAENFAIFEAHMMQDEAIVQCYRVSPGPDFIVVANVPDMPAYHALAHRVFTSQRNVRNVRTFFSTHRAKFDTRVQILPPA